MQSVDCLTAVRIDDGDSYLVMDSEDHYWDEFRLTEQMKRLKIEDSDDYDWGAFHSDAPQLLEKFAQLLMEITVNFIFFNPCNFSTLENLSSLKCTRYARTVTNFSFTGASFSLHSKK